MHLSHSSLLLGLAGVLAMSGCGAPTGVYRGTVTQTNSANGASTTSTTTGTTVNVFASVDPAQIVFDLGSYGYTAQKTGDNLTFQGGQVVSSTFDNGMSTTTLTSGSGTLTGNTLTLSLTLTGSSTSNGQTQNTTSMVSFTGTKI